MQYRISILLIMVSMLCLRGHLQESVVTKKWKLIRTRHLERKPEYELYRIEKDPGEQHNVIAAYPDIASKLKQRLKQEFQQDAKQVNYTLE